MIRTVAFLVVLIGCTISAPAISNQIKTETNKCHFFQLTLEEKAILEDTLKEFQNHKSIEELIKADIRKKSPTLYEKIKDLEPVLIPFIDEKPNTQKGFGDEQMQRHRERYQITMLVIASAWIWPPE